MEKVIIEISCTETGYQGILKDAEGNPLVEKNHVRSATALDQLAREVPSYLRKVA